MKRVLLLFGKLLRVYVVPPLCETLRERNDRFPERSHNLKLDIDDTIERRKGKKIKAKGIYRDPVCSSHSQFVKVSGLRWLSVMLLVEIPWAKRVWALPFLTALAPLQHDFQWQVRQTSWYTKHLPSFSDALALVRRFFWASTFSMSHESFEMVKVPRPLFERLRDLAVYAA